jgi:integrase
MKLKDVVCRWRADYLLTGDPDKTKNPDITCRLHLLPAFGEREIDDIAISEYKAWLAGAKSVNQRYEWGKTLRMVLRWHYDGDMPKKLAAALKTERPRPIRKILSAEQQRRLLSALGKYPVKHSTLIALLWACGLRGSEVIGLQWGDIDLEAGQVYVRRAWVAGKIKSTKTRTSTRTVALSFIARDILSRLPKEALWIFPGKDGVHPISRITMARWVRNILAENSIPLIPVHSFRATWATRLLDGGASPKAIQVQGGWSNYSTMMGIYAQCTEESVKKIIEINDRFL